MADGFSGAHVGTYVTNERLLREDGPLTLLSVGHHGTHYAEYSPRHGKG